MQTRPTPAVGKTFPQLPLCCRQVQTVKDKAISCNKDYGAQPKNIVILKEFQNWMTGSKVLPVLQDLALTHRHKYLSCLLCIVVDLARGGCAISGATPSSFLVKHVVNIVASHINFIKYMSLRLAK